LFSYRGEKEGLDCLVQVYTDATYLRHTAGRMEPVWHNRFSDVFFWWPYLKTKRIFGVGPTAFSTKIRRFFFLAEADRYFGSGSAMGAMNSDSDSGLKISLIMDNTLHLRIDLWWGRKSWQNDRDRKSKFCLKMLPYD
jgi:hypothetical protein